MIDTVQKPTSSLDKCIVLTKNRLNEMPNHDLFQYLSNQLDFIKSNLNAQGKMPDEVYEKLNIGVICAKELEHVDDEFCNAVYTMLDDIGPKIDWGF